MRFELGIRLLESCPENVPRPCPINVHTVPRGGTVCPCSPTETRNEPWCVHGGGIACPWINVAPFQACCQKQCPRQRLVRGVRMPAEQCALPGVLGGLPSSP